ncbi:MAG TPA: alpha/beta hydrolase [Pseudolysinimonas sp.]|nr:alpha/beta hydrolase [Pseudolysinimonas sp.]
MAAPTDAFATRTWETWTEPTIVDVNGIPTAYRRQGSGPTVVYLHGERGTRAWLPIYAKLAENFDVIVPEHPGYGDTPLGEGFSTWQDWILHYEAFFRTLELGEFHLVGDAFGSWLAANLAIYYPDRFASLTLITPMGLRLKDVTSVDVFRLEDDEVNEIFFNGRRDKVKHLLEQENELEDYLQAYQEFGSYALLAWNPRYDIKLDSRLTHVLAPTVVVGVDEDRAVSNEMAKRFADLIPAAELKVVHGPAGQPSGHHVTFEQPNEVAAVIADHVSKNS